jgi:hypothetical protein
MLMATMASLHALDRGHGISLAQFELDVQFGISAFFNV